MATREQLETHSEEFRKELITVAEGVHIAVGYDASNAILLETENFTILVDTLAGTEAAEILKTDLAKLTDKPLVALFYTHSHRDHVSGATVFLEGLNIPIYSRPFSLDMLGAKGIETISKKRARRQFGLGMPPETRINLGLGPGQRPVGGLGQGYLPPTHTIDGIQTVEIDGLTLTCIPAPGECDDNMLIWLADKKVLISGDNYYKSFPNLYPIRGSAYRDVAIWVESLNTMIDLNAEILLPGHSRPLMGKDHIREVLTNYRDGIDFVLQETLKGINAGRTPDEMVEQIQLPDHLRDLPYLQEFYGMVPWSVRAIFTGYLGWFDGNPTNMFPLKQREKAERMAALAGGADALLAQTKSALASEDFQWVLDLTDYLVLLGVEEAVGMKIAALRALAELQGNATARHYYLVFAAELEEKT